MSSPYDDFVLAASNLSGGFTGTIRNIKVYDRGGSNLTPVTGYSPTMHVSGQTEGYQTALIEQDFAGSHTGLATIDVQADTLLDAQTQYANENGLTLTDNLGQWEITK
ncbi:hypothetical protein THIOSC15_450003 [uncultured Thiomicrorhabdus sp.]